MVDELLWWIAQSQLAMVVVDKDHSEAGDQLYLQYHSTPNNSWFMAVLLPNPQVQSDSWGPSGS